MDREADYSTVDLSPYCNAGREALGLTTNDMTGRQTFHGLPFQIGGEAANCYVRLDATHGPVTLSIGQDATYLVFAHRLLESDLLTGGLVGGSVADYAVAYEDGTEIPIPIRERFEISALDSLHSNFPFLAWPDQGNKLQNRYDGKWDHAGVRLIEGEIDWSPTYFLWPWANPRPDSPIESIRIIPHGPCFILAAITLSHVSEHPLRRHAPQLVAITLLQPQDASRSFALEATVDRGIAGYVRTLPSGSSDDFLADDMPGWGEEVNSLSSPCYVEVAAVPSATLQVRLAGEEIGRTAWSDLEVKTSVEPTDRIRLQLIDPGRNWVRTEVVDAATNAQIPCRVHFRSPHGVPYPPHGHNLDVSVLGPGVNVGGDVRLGQATYAYIDGACEGWLPRGDVIVDVCRGFEYEPLRTRVSIAPGQQRLRLELHRWIDMNGARWYSGDTHVHFISSHGSAFEAQAEDLNVVNLLLTQGGGTFNGIQEFSGTPLVVPGGKTIVYVSQENRQHILGHLSLLDLKQPVAPWGTDGLTEASPGSTLETTLSSWADACHAQGGTVVIPHLPSPNGEPAVLIATGRADAVEMLVQRPFNHIEYYRYLNGGYRLPLVGGTDKMSNEVPVGLYRTYVRIPADEEFTYTTWLRNLRLGRTFLSGGPILHLTVDGREIGDTLHLPTGGGEVEIEARVDSTIPINTLEIVERGKVVASTSSSKATKHLSLREKIHVNQHSWLAARSGTVGYFGLGSHQDDWRSWFVGRHHDEWHRGVMAHTSPIYVAVGSEWHMYDANTTAYMLTLAQGGLAYVHGLSSQYQDSEVTHHHGESDHLKYLERPFREAIETLESRRTKNEHRG